MKIDPGEIHEAIEQDIDDADGDIGRHIHSAAETWAKQSAITLRKRGSVYDYDTDPVADEIEVGDVSYEGSRQKGQMHIPIRFKHQASSYFDHGTEDHVITPTNATVLRVPWPDAPPAVKRKRGDSPYFFDKVEVSGITALRFVEAGKRAALDHLEDV